MKIVGIIPSRYASTRFPGKPLVDISGKPMIQRVYEQAKKAKLLNDVIVATDDERILKCVLGFGGKAGMTSSKHKSGTDRCAEVVKNFYRNFDVAINIQGDEPYIHPQQIDEVAKCFTSPQPSSKERAQLATLVKKIENEADIFNMNRIKVVIDKSGNALYFSRSAIPSSPSLALPDGKGKRVVYFKHIGIYGYLVKTLLEITKLKQSPLEIAESLEQLRWIENGYKIKTRITQYESVSVDAPEDLGKLQCSPS